MVGTWIVYGKRAPSGFQYYVAQDIPYEGHIPTVAEIVQIREYRNQFLEKYPKYTGRFEKLAKIKMLDEDEDLLDDEIADLEKFINSYGDGERIVYLWTRSGNMDLATGNEEKRALVAISKSEELKRFDGPKAKSQCREFIKTATASKFSVLECSICGKTSILKVENGRVKCCNRSYPVSEPLSYEEAVLRVPAEVASAKPKQDDVSVGPLDFYYRGRAYFPDDAGLMNLNYTIYNEYDYRRIVTEGEDGEISFTEPYRAFLEHCDKYHNIPFGSGGLYAAYMRYVSEYSLIPENAPLRWEAGNKRYAFADCKDFAQKCRDDPTKDYLDIFMNSPGSFFMTYDRDGTYSNYDPMELTRLVAEYTGKYVRFEEDGVTDFGNSFLSNLSDRSKACKE